MGLLNPDILAHAVREIEVKDVLDLVEELGDKPQKPFLRF